MPKKAATPIVIAPTVDPIVEMSRRLLALWDAEAGAEVYHRAENAVDYVKRDTVQQLNDWRNAIEETISYTQACGIQGALLQIALASGELDELVTELSYEDRIPLNPHELKIQRLLNSAIRAILNAAVADIDQVTRELVKTYTSAQHPAWIDHVDGWALEGRRAARLSEGNRDRESA